MSYRISTEGYELRYAVISRYIDLAISYCFDTFNFSEGTPRIRDEQRVFFENLMCENVDNFLYRQGLDVALQRGYLIVWHGFIDELYFTDHLIMERE
jgi:hypothetical protein